MPDGDIIYNKLRGCYQKPYQWICEGSASDQECLNALLRALKTDLLKKGNLPIRIAQFAGHLIFQVVSSGNLSEVDFKTLNIECEKLISELDGPPDIKELSLRAVKRYLHDLRYKRGVKITHAHIEILEYYITEVFDSEFRERIPLQSHFSLEGELVANRLNAMEMDLRNGIQKFAQDAMQMKKMENLKIPRRKTVKPIDIDEDLLAS
jgi:hypothetical protein